MFLHEPCHSMWYVIGKSFLFIELYLLFLFV
jgi:hypothetical protein